MSDNGTSWASVIPEFFYELIGRIIPGGTFILGLIYTIDQTILCDVILKQKIDGSSIAPSYSLIFILFLGLSYSAGFFLTPLGDELSKLINIKSQYREKFEQFDSKYYEWLYTEAFITKDASNGSNTIPTIPTFGKLSNEKGKQLFQYQHDRAKKGNPEQARSLSKSQADVQLCINTSAAFFIIAIVPLFKLVRYLFEGNTLNESIWLNTGVALIIAVGFLRAAYYRNNRFLSRQFSLSWEAHKVKIENDNKPPQNKTKNETTEPPPAS